MQEQEAICFLQRGKKKIAQTIRCCEINLDSFYRRPEAETLHILTGGAYVVIKALALGVCKCVTYAGLILKHLPPPSGEKQCSCHATHRLPFSVSSKEKETPTPTPRVAWAPQPMSEPHAVTNLSN